MKLLTYLAVLLFLSFVGFQGIILWIGPSEVKSMLEVFNREPHFIQIEHATNANEINTGGMGTASFKKTALSNDSQMHSISTCKLSFSKNLPIALNFQYNNLACAVKVASTPYGR